MPPSEHSAEGQTEKQPPAESLRNEEPETPRSSHAPTDTEKVVYADGTVEYVDKHALGGDFDQMPVGYYKSPQFLGTLAVSLCAPMDTGSGEVSELTTMNRLNLSPVSALTWAGYSRLTLCMYFDNIYLLVDPDRFGVIIEMCW